MEQPIYVVTYQILDYDSGDPEVFVYLDPQKAWTKYHGLAMKIPRGPLEQGHHVTISSVVEGNVCAPDRVQLDAYSPDTLAGEHKAIQERHESRARYAKKKGKPYSYLKVAAFSYEEHGDVNSYSELRKFY